MGGSFYTCFYKSRMKILLILIVENLESYIPSDTPREINTKIFTPLFYLGIL